MTNAKFPKVIGLTLDEARQKFPTIKIRAINIDGKEVIRKMDAIGNRLNVFVVKNKITKVVDWG